MNSMDFDYRDWERYYIRLRNDYQSLRKISHTAPASDVKDLQTRLASVEKSLQIMKSSPMQYELVSSELARRTVIVENLKKAIGSLNHADARAKLLTSSGGSAGSSSAGSSGTVNPMASSDRALIQRQQDVMKMQDNMLLDIEKGVDRLHGQALEIKSETLEQNKILDNLDEHVDVATAGLKQETEHAELIKQRTSDCYYYLCIVLEVVVLLILIIVMFIK